MRGFSFDRKTLSSDLLSSMVVFLVALPLCMGIAIASGVPPALGIITGIIGGIVVGVIAGSPLQVSGPAAGLAVIVYQLVQDNGLSMLGPILLTAGLLQLLAGIFRMGQWFRAITPDVIYGMLAGIGVLIFASQFHVMVDDKPRATGLASLLSIPEAIYKGVFPMDDSTHHVAAGIGLLSILTLIVWSKLRPAALRMVPAPLMAVAVAMVVCHWQRLDVNYVNIPSDLTEAMTVPTIELLRRMLEPKLLGQALALAFIASAETLLSALAVDRMHDGPRTNYDRELAAQGIGNMLCGSVGSLPMTGVIVRSSANVQAGAKTRMSAILHGVWLLALVVTMPWLLEEVPTAALAAILVHTGWKLVNVESIKRLASYGYMPVAIYAATVIGIVAVDLLTGVLVGLALSIAKLLYKVSHLTLRVEPRPDSHKVDLHMEGSATFLRLPKLADTLEALPPGVELHVHMDRLGYIDHACLEALAEWEKQKRSQGSTLVVEWEDLVARYQRTPEQPAAA